MADSVDREVRRQAMLAEVRVIAARLNERAPSLAQDLLPNGHAEGGRYWRCGNLAGDAGQSLCIDVSGATQGQWTDFAACKGMPEHAGDMLDLVMLVKFGGRKKDAIAWARSYLGMDGLDPARLATEQAKVRAHAKAREAEAKAKAERMVRRARGLFHPKGGAVPIPDTPAEWYLAGRGIDLSMLEVDGQAYVPGALAFHPAVRCVEAEADLPCLIARVLDANGQHVATHRTWLAEGPAGWGKAPLAQPKMAMGAFAGGYIPLWKGACRATLAEIAPGTDVYVSEGIEDGLSVACARPELRVIAAIALGNLGGIVLPEQAGRLVVIAQNDPPGSKAEAALRAAVERQQATGRAVAVMRPPAGVKDFNDVLRGATVREEAA